MLHTSDGRRILDFTSGQMSSILGHSHPAITATMREAAGTLAVHGAWFDISTGELWVMDENGDFVRPEV